MINVNFEAILRYVYENDSSLEEIMKGLSQSNIDEKLSTVRFIIDLFNNSKQLQSELKEAFFTQLVKEKLISLLIEIMTYNEYVIAFTTKIDNSIIQSDDGEIMQVMKRIIDSVEKRCQEPNTAIVKIPKGEEIDPEYEVKKIELLKVHVAEILTNCFQILPSTVSLMHYFLGTIKAILLSETQKNEDYLLLSQLASLFLYSPFDGMKLEINELFKNLLDPSSKDLKDEFFDVFYSRILPAFIDYLTASNNSFTMSLVLEILSMCGIAHGYRIRHYITHNGVLQQLNCLYFHKKKSLRLSMIGFTNAVISNNDENLNKYVAKHDLLSPIFKLLEATKRDNLLMSTCFDLLNLIAVKDMSKLLAYIMEKYKLFVVEGTYSNYPVMKNIQSKYENLFLSQSSSRKDIIPRRVMPETKKDDERNVNLLMCNELCQKRPLPNNDENNEVSAKKRKIDEIQ